MYKWDPLAFCEEYSNKRGQLVFFEKRKDKLSKECFYVFVIQVRREDQQTWKKPDGQSNYLIYRRLSEFRGLYLNLVDELKNTDFPKARIPQLQVIKEGLFTSHFQVFDLLLPFISQIDNNQRLQKSDAFQRFLARTQSDQTFRNTASKNQSSHYRKYLSNSRDYPDFQNWEDSSDDPISNKKKTRKISTVHVLRPVKIEYPLTSQYEYEVEVVTKDESYVLVKNVNDFLKLESDLKLKYSTFKTPRVFSGSLENKFKLKHLKQLTSITRKLATSYANHLCSFLKEVMLLESKPETIQELIEFIEL